MNNSSSLRLIYSNLQDDHSNVLFENRLMYAATKDIKYIINENLCDISHYQFLKDCIDNSVIVFTSDPHGEFICKTLLSIGIKINAIYNASLMSNKKSYYHGLKVISFNELLTEYKESFIILADVYDSLRQDIHKLIGNGFSSKKMIQLKQPQPYFDLIKRNPLKEEIYIDAGSLYGDAIINFINWCGNDYKKIYAFEPDTESYNVLEKRIKDNNIKNILTYNKGLWSTPTELNFSRGDFADSKIIKSGEKKITTDTIDNIVKNDLATLIKFNIEGSELEALKGAYNTITKNKPALAICIYHKPEDIVDIPLYILSNHDYYNLYIRKYSWLTNRLVLYCIP